MSKKAPHLFVFLSYLPWWASIVAGLLFYIGLTYLFPLLVEEVQILSVVVATVKSAAPWLSLFFLIPAISSIFRSRKRKKLIEYQSSIETLQETSWSDFEVLVSEAFRRKGFKVQENMTAGADGGIDLTLSKDGALHIVQCKQWRKSKVGVAVVREMFGVLKASSAKTVYVISSGEFTKEAKSFADPLPITLINGAELLALVSEVHKNQVVDPIENEGSIKKCPKCGSTLITRIAKKGAHKGKEFLGCSSFPKCRYVASQ